MVAMLLHTDNERIKSNIRKFVRVSPEVKATIRKTWQEGKMATSRAYYSCATCGIRDHGNYAQIDVAALPDFFKKQQGKPVTRRNTSLKISSSSPRFDP